MAQAGIAHRYAQALFGAALGEQALDAVAADLAALVALDAADARLRLFLESPQTLGEHKRALLEHVLGGRTHPLTGRFLRLLLDKKRITYLGAAAAAYRELLEQHRGVLHAKVTTAVPLTAAERQRLQAALERRTGRPTVLETRVDREILGGAIAQLGDQILDDSVRTHLAEIREALLGARS
jgi:F-type H+-transporting ATPase subunit delta